jgi:hypothetical protein
MNAEGRGGVFGDSTEVRVLGGVAALVIEP